MLFLQLTITISHTNNNISAAVNLTASRPNATSFTPHHRDISAGNAAEIKKRRVEHASVERVVASKDPEIHGKKVELGACYILQTNTFANEKIFNATTNQNANGTTQ